MNRDARIPEPQDPVTDIDELNEYDPGLGDDVKRCLEETFGKAAEPTQETIFPEEP